MRVLLTLLFLVTAVRCSEVCSCTCCPPSEFNCTVYRLKVEECIDCTLEQCRRLLECVETFTLTLDCTYSQRTFNNFVIYSFIIVTFALVTMALLYDRVPCIKAIWQQDAPRTRQTEDFSAIVPPQPE